MASRKYWCFYKKQLRIYIYKNKPTKSIDSIIICKENKDFNPCKKFNVLKIKVNEKLSGYLIVAAMNEMKWYYEIWKDSDESSKTSKKVFWNPFPFFLKTGLCFKVNYVNPIQWRIRKSSSRG